MKNIVQIKILINFIIVLCIVLVFWEGYEKFGIILLIVVALLTSIFCLRYLNEKNKKINFYIITFFVLLILYGLNKYNISNILISNKSIIVFIIFLFMVYYIFAFRIFAMDSNDKINNYKLFRERKEDLKRIKEYLNKFNIIGINGEWGSGKTYLLECLQNEKDMKDKYEFVNIYLLTCNLDNLSQILINELEKVLVKYGIYSRYSNSLRKILATNNFIDSLFSSMILDTNSFTASINGFKNEIRKLDKTLVIVFEDLDRIDYANVIKKILSVSENLVDENIKIVYQYDQSNLERINECFNRNYLDKYIPYTINLTQISFFDIIDKVLKEFENEYEYIKKNDFNFLRIHVRLDWVLREIFNKNIEYSLKIYNYSIRKVKHFLDEIESTFENEEMYRENDLRKAVVIFYLIKHFDYDIYNKFTLSKGLIETFTLNVDGEEYTIDEIIYKFKNNEFNSRDIDKILINDLNRKVLGYLFLIEYRLNNKEKRGIEILEETEIELGNNNYNDKINRVFWHLLCKGKSEYTDMEQMVEILNRDVLSLSDNKMIEGFNNFMDKMYNEKYKDETGNIVSFYMGIPGFHTLFQAVSIASGKESDWLKFLSFYFTYKKLDTVNLELIRCLRYCNLRTKNIYFFVINKFNDLKVISNMNGYNSYWQFLLKYLTALSTFGFIDMHDVRGMLDEKDNHDVHFLKEYLFPHMLEKLKQLKEKMPIETPKGEIDSIITFINKNIEIISKDTAFKEELPIKISTQVYFKSNNIEIERLNGLNCTEVELLKEIEESYQNGQISANDITHLDLVKRKELKIKQ